MSLSTIVKLTLAAAVLAVISLWMGHQAYSWMPVPASAEALLIDNLFSFMTAVGSFIFFGVTGTLLYSILFQRADKYDEGDGPPITGNLKLEVVWTAIPILLVIWIAGYSYRIYDQMAVLGPMDLVHMDHLMPSAMAASLEAEALPVEAIDVRARQWVWEFSYPDRNLTTTELHIPSNTRIKLALESEDVLHGFFIPAFRLKQDVIPGRHIDFEFTPIREGTYRLRDSQYSGTYFAAMQANVVVESPEAYQRWLDQTAALPPTPGLSPAYAEYQQTLDDSRPGWKTVEPAPFPQVNYAGSPAIPFP
jgi:cytochrome c oxidase subunit 2